MPNDIQHGEDEIEETDRALALEELSAYPGAEDYLEEGASLGEGEGSDGIDFQKEKASLAYTYKAVTGAIPTKRDLADWPEEKFIGFYHFVLLFVRKNGKGETVIQTPEKLVREVEKYLFQRNHPYQEFIFRIDRFTDSPGFSTRKYYYRVAALLRQVGNYLRANPSVVSPKLEAVIKPEPRFNWCLRLTKLAETKLGAEVVVYENTDDLQDGMQEPVKPVTYEQKYIEAVLKATDVFSMVAKSIKKKDIDALPPKDKIIALSRLSFVANLHKSFRPGTSAFKQINIFAANREDLEGAMLHFGKKDT